MEMIECIKVTHAGTSYVERKETFVVSEFFGSAELEVIEMTQAELDALPEFMGF